MVVAGTPGRPARTGFPWAPVAGLVFTLGLAITLWGHHRIDAFVHQQGAVCAPQSLVPMQVPGSLFATYWAGVTVTGLAVPLLVIAATRRGHGLPGPRRPRTALLLGAVLPVTAAIVTGMTLQSVPLAIVIGACTAAGTAPAYRRTMLGTGPRTALLGLLAVAVAGLCLVMAGATQQLHTDIRESRDLCTTGFRATAPF